jgi:hypothetical protein
MSQVLYLDALPPGFAFESMVREVQRAGIPWSRHYGEYQSGDWWTCSLLGRSADATDGEVTDSDRPQETDALEKLPITRKLLQDLPLNYMLARLARLDPRGALWEHRDYQDLRLVPRHRIHLPLDTNPDAYLVSNGRRFHMGLASLSTFCPTTAHGACNRGDRPRVHLILDVYEDERLQNLLARATESPYALMPEISARNLAEKIRALRRVFPEGDTRTNSNAQPDFLSPWERSALGLYFEFAIPEGQLYELLEQVHLEDGNRVRSDFWAARRQLVLGKGLYA